jgi:hypothetical protein
MVRDNVTGLIWEVKTDDGSVHDRNNTYTWYDRNDGEAGTPGEGTDTEDFINDLNTQNFGGYSDWRMPTIQELASITNKGIYNPTVNMEYFPGTQSSFYWSDTNWTYSIDYVWGIPFDYGYGYGNYKSQSYYVRAVRSGQSDIGLFDNGDGTVTDEDTGLMWQQATGEEINWEDALLYCESLVLGLGEYDDWRLPTIEELRSIVEYSTASPAIDINYFSVPESSLYWSSTTYAYFPSGAWAIDFINGWAHGNTKTRRTNYYARAVRSKQSNICVGDCNGDSSVSIAEVQSAINQFLGLSNSEGCNDQNGDSIISISEIQTIINNHLKGC